MALEGTLKDFPLPDIIQLLGLSRKTGAVDITGSDGSGAGRLFFQGGKVVSAALNGLPPLEAAFHFFTFAAGSFRFAEGEQPDPALPPITISNEYLIMEGIRRADEWAALRSRVPSLDLPLGLVADPVAVNRDINLKPDEWRVLTMINGRDTIRQIAQRSQFGDFKTAQIVHHLLTVGLVEPLEAPPPPPPPPALVWEAPPPAVPPPDRAPAQEGAPARPAPAPIRPLPPPPAPAPLAAAPRLVAGASVYARLEAIATSEFGATGRLLLSDAYKRLRVRPGSDLDTGTVGALCAQFERGAGMLVGSGRARTISETLRRAAAEFFSG
jgi:hypothetical protein